MVDKISKGTKDNDRSEDIEGEPQYPVSAGPVDKVIELAFNPSRDKIREVTIIDRVQARLFPVVDMVNYGRQHIMEIALCRQNKTNYSNVYKRIQPKQPDLIDELIHRTAQWQKSLAGKNLERATDIALAETEAKSGEGDDLIGGGDIWKDD